MPLTDAENSVMPYVTVSAQKGAIPGSIAGQNLYHEEVTNILLLGVSCTIIFAIVIWVCIKIKEKIDKKKVQNAHLKAVEEAK